MELLFLALEVAMTIQNATIGMKIGIVRFKGCRCQCGHKCLPCGEDKPRVCPKCKSPNWGRPKQR